MNNYDISKYDNLMNHVDFVLSEMKDIEDTVIYLLENNDNIFEIRKKYMELNKWSLKFHFLRYLFKYCLDRDQAEYISLLFKEMPPDCGNVYANFLNNMENEMYNRIDEIDCQRLGCHFD